MKTGCTCDMELNGQPESCVLDTGDIDDCTFALKGLDKTTCGYWHIESDRGRLVREHAADMARVLNLPKNAQKGSWEGMEVHELLDLARVEFDEFVAAIWKLESGKGSVEHVAAEGCDVSNFLAMITDNYRRKSV